MTPQFDPTALRRHWDDWLHRLFSKQDITKVAATARSHYSRLLVAELVEAYLIGYAGSVESLLKAHLTGMLSVPEPNRRDFSDSTLGEEAWLQEVYGWRQDIGLCRWLSGGRSERDLTAALSADWQAGQAAQGSEDFKLGERCQGASLRVATALAADAPRLGLQVIGECESLRPFGTVGPLIDFGAWACNRLVTNGRRDQEYLSRGKQALTATLLQVLLPDVRKIEIALWIKAIFFDSEAARSAEEAMMLAYECMPGVHPPDFE